ncbi:PspA/IM30 family protein [Nevskia soli]|jgi:phage shock protein A|uniref:PspA/IM30 family protein n=1 Tax=Nevskia soli TaxID=418856 RepID=UPI0015D7A8EE|nr:PspA/IM30 family protein [Nevskia soli]
MALLERVATLLRANLNDMIDRAEDPLKMMNQVILDMENQLLQVKTQVAIAVADHHLLERKKQENLARESDWMRKAEMSLERGDEDLARAAIERALPCREMAASFSEQVEDQRVQVETLKATLQKLDAKLAEARTQAELLKAQARRARAANRAADVQITQLKGLGRAKEKIDLELALGQAKTELLIGDGVDEKFAAMEKQDRVEKLLAELKSKKQTVQPKLNAAPDVTPQPVRTNT